MFLRCFSVILVHQLTHGLDSVFRLELLDLLAHLNFVEALTFVERLEVFRQFLFQDVTYKLLADK